MGKSIEEILKLNPNTPADYEVLDREYIPKGIGSIKIGGKTYTNYGAYWFFWEKTYLKEVTRSGNGSMSNINNITTFLTGHLVIDFSLISIDDYRSIMRSHYEQNEFLVECYDPIYNKIASLKMYFATEERKKLHLVNKNRFNDGAWEDFLVLAGVQDYQLEMIGTNNDLDTVTVTYNLNAPDDVGEYTQTIGGQDVAKGGDFICGRDIEYNVTSETFNGKYRFAGWNSRYDGNGQSYADGYVYTIYDSLVLYAIWKPSESLVLSYSYGLAEPMTDSNGKPVYSKQVLEGQAIGDLPTFPSSIPVKVGKSIATYYPYTNGGWYKTSTKAVNSTPLKATDLYWTNKDTQIYLLYDVSKYEVFYYSSDELSASQMVEYNAPLPNFSIGREGLKFSGWYLDHTFKTPAPTLMPPYNITLYAKWEGWD